MLSIFSWSLKLNILLWRKNRRRDLIFSENSLLENFHSGGLWLGCRSCIYKKNIRNDRFLGNFANFSRTATLQNICELLLLFKPSNDNPTKWSNTFKQKIVNPLSANPIKWLNTLKQLFDCVWPFRGVGA